MSAKFLIWTAVLAGALFFPISNIVHVLSVRRLERKTKRKLEEAEISGQRQRARFIAIFVSIVFAFLFNFNVFGTQ